MQRISNTSRNFAMNRLFLGYVQQMFKFDGERLRWFPNKVDSERGRFKLRINTTKEFKYPRLFSPLQDSEHRIRLLNRIKQGPNTVLRTWSFEWQTLRYWKVDLAVTNLICVHNYSLTRTQKVAPRQSFTICWNGNLVDWKRILSQKFKESHGVNYYQTDQFTCTNLFQ